MAINHGIGNYDLSFVEDRNSINRVTRVSEEF